MHCKQIKDHNGRVFNSIADACSYYGVRYGTFCKRRERGLSLELMLGAEALNRTVSVDHLGNKYRSIRAMCKKYGIYDSTFRERLGKGWSLKKCLSPENEHEQDFYDHNGKRFVSLADMARHWNIPVQRLRYRLAHHWLVKDALTVPYRQGCNNQASEEEELEEKKRIDAIRKQWEKV